MDMVEMNKEYKAFIDTLQGYIDRNSIEEVAEKYKCSPSYIYQILNGQKVAGRKTQLKIANACGCETINVPPRPKLALRPTNLHCRAGYLLAAQKTWHNALTQKK